ncbi:MAG TPA: hypothetical protein VFS29_08735 [Motilibacteraceae bacterium]|nr:hypothetical protein [Motilibacteraceae bacterium]
MGASWARRGIGLLLAALLLGTGGWVDWLHTRTWDWGIRPAAAPTRLELFSRHYQRDSVTSVPLPVDAQPLGRTLGGGQILGQRPDPYVPTGVWVRTPDGLSEYSLLGGP